MDRTTRSLVLLLAAVVAAVAGGGMAAGDPVASDGSTPSSIDVAPTSLAQTGCSFPVTASDVTGTTVTLEERPERIVVLQPSDAQIVWEIGGSSRVVGMPQGPTTDYLEDTAGITNVKFGNGTTNVEAVTDLSPDLILAANVTRPATVEQLRSTGTPLYHFGGVSSMTETYRTINRTGHLIGNCEGAAAEVDSMRDRLRTIERAIGDAEEPDVLYGFYGYVAGDDTHLDSMIDAAGGENVAASAGISGYEQMNQEVVRAENPQWIVQPSTAPAPSGAGYNATIAVRDGQVFDVDANYANQAGPRVVRVVETMAQRFHPEAFDENGEPIVETTIPNSTENGVDGSDGTATPGSGDATDANATDANATDPATDASGPGFTAATVLLAALVAVLALGVRRNDRV